MDQAAAKNQVWTNRILLALFLVCAVLAFELMRPFLSPLVLASFLVAALHRPYGWLEARLGHRKHLAAALATLAVAVLGVLPAAVFLTMLVHQLAAWVGTLERWLGPGAVSHAFTGDLPPQLQTWMNHYLPIGRDELATYAARAAAWASAVAPSVVSVSVDVLVQLFVLAVALYYLFMDGRALVHWLVDISPLSDRYSHELLREFYRVSYAMLVGTAAVALLQGLAAWLVFAVLGVANALVWAMALSFASFVPVVGVALVYVPMTLVLFASGEHVQALVLGVYSVGVIGIVIDHGVRPQLVKGTMTMHPLVVFVSIFGGVYLFGVVGLLLGPLIASILITVLRIYARDLSLRQAIADPVLEADAVPGRRPGPSRR